MEKSMTNHIVASLMFHFFLWWLDHHNRHQIIDVVVIFSHSY